MQPLSKELRNIFERTIIRARDVSETAARIAIEQLGVEQAAPYSYLTENQRELRRKLRLHGRQLGDERDSQTDRQEIDRLIEEVAYEHWHRMLFARFLAENNLLMYFEDNDIQNAVSVTLSECEELAGELKYKNGWALAAALSAKMLPQIFRANSPVFEIEFYPENQKELEALLLSLDKETFLASDGLGWAYQFWQSKKKEQVNDSGIKIGERELPAVTQLFTDPYMVSFLLDNSLGAWWANKRLSKEKFSHLSNEEDLRRILSLPGVQFDYLRLLKNEDGTWVPASGEKLGWPEELSKLKLLDPCCGSGHFLVSAFHMLVELRIKIENLSAKEACDVVIRENIHGLEIDQRCVELAAFAVALSAWKYPSSGGFRKLPELHIAWCGQSLNVKKDEWLSIADGDTDFKYNLEVLYTLFKDAPILGSLINPKDAFQEGTLFGEEWGIVNKLIQKKLSKTRGDFDELAIVAQGLEKAFQLLSDKYDLVVTNVPYLKGGNQSDQLKSFCEKNYPNSKYDLANVFIERIKKLLKSDGTMCVVTQQAWLFSKYFENLREKLLKELEFGFIARLGANAFEVINGEHVNVCLLIMHNSIPNPSYMHCGYDLDQYKDSTAKARGLINDEIICLEQKQQLQNPSYRIIFDESIYEDSEYISQYADFGKGSVSGDRAHYIRKIWELPCLSKKTKLWLNSPKHEIGWSGREEIILWGDEFNPEREVGFRHHGQRVFSKKGIAIGKTGKMRFTPYTGELFDDNVVVISPYNEEDLLPLWNYITSDVFIENIKKLDKKLCVTAGTFPQVSFKRADFTDQNPCIDIDNAFSSDPTQWVFHGFPSESDHVLQVAVARLLGYKWPAEFDSEIKVSNKSMSLLKKCDELLDLTDSDGIVCLPSVRGEASAADRLLNLLARVYPDQDLNTTVSGLLGQVDHAGKSLESWLRDKYFIQHNKLFDNTPFIWHIWDGLPDGFATLVNYHKLDKKNLETLTYTYLGDWINKQKSEMLAGVIGAEEKYSAAENLKKNLELILVGEAPHDIFVRWKTAAANPIGWEPDLNDGVRINIRPFMSVSDVGKKGAGILRDKPNIKWDKDRGKDSETSPWYTIHKGERINDYHLSLSDKKKAREELRCDVSESNTTINKCD